MYFTKRNFRTLLHGLLTCFFAFAVSGCDSGKSRTEWSASSLASIVKELKANGIDASAGNIYAPGGQNTLCLDIRLEDKNQRKMPFYTTSPFSDEDRAFRSAERDAIFEANKLDLQESVKKDFEVISRVLQGKEIPLLRFSGFGSSYAFPYYSTLQCKYLGLEVDTLNFEGRPDSAKILSDMPALKRLHIPDGTIIAGITLPLVEDVSIDGLRLPRLFKIESVGHAFPNMRSLTLPNGVLPIDYGAAKFPASLTSFSIAAGSSTLINAYNLNGAKKMPSITRINGIPAGEFDPVKDFTPEQLTRYNAIPSHIWAEKRFAAFRDQPEKNYGSVPLCGKIMLHTPGGFLPQKMPEGLDERLRNSMTENADECDVLIVIATETAYDPFARELGRPGSGPVAYNVTHMYILSRDGVCEVHSLNFKPPVGGISEEQRQRNARNRASGGWGELELLFKKANDE